MNTHVLLILTDCTVSINVIVRMEQIVTMLMVVANVCLDGRDRHVQFLVLAEPMA